MRPELREYHYDWLMHGTLLAASRVPRGAAKETQRMYRYIPGFRKTAQTFYDAGEPGVIGLEIMAKYYENILTAHSRGKKIAATTFCNSPVLLYAMDLVPATFEVLTALGGALWRRGMFDFMDYCSELGMTETSCSSQKGAMGAVLAGLMEPIDLVICDTPGVCDTNANAFAFVSEYLNKPFFQLNYPSCIGDSRSERYHLEDYKAMIRFIEAHTGIPLDYNRLAEALSEVNRQDALIADLEDMCMLKPMPMPPIFNLLLYAGRFCFSGCPEYTRLLESMVAWALERANRGESGLKIGRENLRVFMCYIDHYTVDLNFFNYLEERGIALSGSILSKNFRSNNRYAETLPGSSYDIDLSSEDAMLDSVAQMNARMPMVRSIRGPYDRPGMWLEESLALARISQSDCIIYNGTPGCRNTWGMVKPYARDLERRGFPVHIMYGDAFDDRVESWETSRDRLDEFFHIRGLL